MKEYIVKALCTLVLILVVFGGVSLCIEQHNTYETLTKQTTQPVIERYHPEGIQFLTKDNGICEIVFTTDKEKYWEVRSALCDLVISHNIIEFNDPDVNQHIKEELKRNYGIDQITLQATVVGTYSTWVKND